MFIEYLKLKNFIGIYKGTGKKEIEINFSKDINGRKIKNRNKFVILLGSNGSGKTTIMNSLTPRSGNDDVRKSLILPDEEGYKELRIRKNDDLYTIKHHYTKAGIKSYISKNGNELNPNGLVRSFEQVISDELGYTNDYIRVGRIGTVVGNFIDLKSGERKKYISNLLPNIEEYLEAYKNVHKRFSILKNKITYITENINKLPDEKQLKSNISITEKSIATINESIKKTESELNKNLGRIENIKNEISKENLDNSSLYNDAMEDFNTSKSKLNHFLEKYPNLSKYKTIKDIKDKIAELSDKLKDVTDKIFKKNTSLENIKAEILKNKNFIASKNDKINNISNEDLDSLKSLLKEKNKVLLESEEFLNDNKDYQFTQDDYKSLISLKNLLEVIFSDIKTIFDEYIADNIRKYISKDMDLETINEKIETLKNHIPECNNKIKATNAAILILEERKNAISSLSKRPKECKIDSCYFISKAIKYQNTDTDGEIDNRKKIIENLEADIESSNKKINRYETYQAIENDILSLYKRFQSQISDTSILNKIPISKYFTKYKKFKEIFLLTEKEIENLFNIDKLVEFLENMNDTENLKENIKSIEEKIKYLSETGNLLDDLKTEISIKKKENEVLLESEKALTEELDKLVNSKEKSLNRSIKVLNEYKRLKKIKKKSNKILKENKEIFERLNIKLQRIKMYKEENESLKIEINKLYNELEPLNKENIKNQTLLNKLIEYIETKESLNESFDELKILDEALNPIKGIPVFFIENYLNSTRKIANELLSIAYGSKLLINKLRINESDFLIPIIGDDGIEKEDIIECSQGEIALAKISLCFALIEQSKSNYNIAYLDEIDSTLDSNNRRYFIDMLEKQVERMDIEQLFVISHNNYFDSSNSDLILLKDHELNLNDDNLKNSKNIIYKV